jgi:calcium/proton exchanger cax
LHLSVSSHKHLFTSDSEEEEPQLNTGTAIGLLILATVLVGVTSEWLVDAIDGVADAPGAPPKTWIGLILLPIVSNAAEHVTAVTVAVKDKLDLSMAVAVGSSIQISIFVLPLLVVIAWIAGKVSCFPTLLIQALFSDSPLISFTASLHALRSLRCALPVPRRTHRQQRNSRRQNKLVGRVSLDVCLCE